MSPTIDIFVWNDHFNTGLPTVDAQHRQLLALLNRLAGQLVFAPDGPGLQRMLNELTAYAAQHFHDEEAIWAQYLPEDPLEVAHRASHAEFVEQVMVLVGAQQHQPVADLTERLLGFLAQWLVSHILGADRRMAAVVLALQQGLDLATAHQRATEQVAASAKPLMDIVLSVYGALATQTPKLLREIYERQLASDALQASEARMRSLFEKAPLAYQSLDLAGHILEVNLAWCQQMGYTRDEVLGHFVGDYIADESQETLREEFPKFQAQGRTDGPVFEMIRKDGGRFLWLVNGRIARDDQGHALHTHCLLTDITERQRSERELQRREQYLRAVLDNFPFIIWLKDSENRYLAVNQAFARASGAQSPQALVGKSDADIWPTALADIYRRDDELVLRSGQPLTVEEPVNGPGQQGWVETYKSPVLINGQVIGTVGYARDITERKAAEDKLLLAASVFTHALEGILITTPDGVVVEVNEAFTRITGYSRAEVLGQHTRLLSSGRQGKTFYAQMWQALIAQGRWTGEIWNRRKSGEVYAEMLTISAVCNHAGEVLRYVALFSDISQQKEHEHRLEHIAHYDALTGLPNRVLLADRLRQAMAQTVRRGRQLGLVFLDLDGFKAVNDAHGHDTGDQLLMALATRMQKALRDGDTLARLGGDEFVAVLGDLPDPDAAAPVLERLRLAAAQPFVVEGLGLQVSASLGVTYFPQRADIDAEQLLRQADQAMYQAKLAGKNRCHVFDAEQDRHLRGRHEGLEAMRQGLRAQAFELYYQPKVHLRTGALLGAEALIRWHHPIQGLLTPAAFLPLLSQDALAIELGDWVLEAALAQIERWKEQGLRLPVSVNIDALHLQHPHFMQRLKTLLAAHPHVEAGELELEILETSALDDIALVSQLMNDCRQIGVAFALDDFGTGYSSLTYLRRLPAALLKIDQSFVRDMLDDPEDMAILEGVLGLARAFRRQVIAEGVETPAHGDMLLRLGCDWGQGYAIARPMPAADVLAWHAQWQPHPGWAQVPLTPREDLPLLTAMVEHRSWVAALVAHLHGERAAPPELDLRGCHFGRWLDSHGQNRHGHLADFARVEALHKAIHQQAQRLVDFKQQGQAEQILAGLPALYAARDALLAQLLALLDGPTTG